MANEAVKKIKLQIPAGKATPAPPVGTVLGPAGINLQDFCTKYNDATRDKMGDILPVEISIYEDRSFDFIIKTPPTSFLLKKYAKINKGSVRGSTEKVATISQAQLREIAEIKLPDLNAYDVEAAMKVVLGTAKNMGIAVEGMETLKEQPVQSAPVEESNSTDQKEQEVAEVETEKADSTEAAE